MCAGNSSSGNGGQPSIGALISNWQITSALLDEAAHGGA